MTDVRITAHDSVLRFDLLSIEATNFMDKQVITEWWQWAGKTVVTPLHIGGTLITMMQDNGLTIETASIEH